MSNHYIYPKDEFKLEISLEVSVSSVGMWKGVSEDDFHKLYGSMLEDGSLKELIKEDILWCILNRDFECKNPQPFDRLHLEFKCNEGDVK